MTQLRHPRHPTPTRMQSLPLESHEPQPYYITIYARVADLQAMQSMYTIQTNSCYACITRQAFFVRAVRGQASVKMSIWTSVRTSIKAYRFNNDVQLQNTTFALTLPFRCAGPNSTALPRSACKCVNGLIGTCEALALQAASVADASMHLRSAAAVPKLTTLATPLQAQGIHFTE